MALCFVDFFAGAGLATLGLTKAGWRCIWANDIDPRKQSVYVSNFGDREFVLGDLAGISARTVPAGARMAWASFPCQDLSLAGWRKGLSAERSGVFWAFWRIMREQMSAGRRPPMIVIENVPGLLYGDSFAGLCEAVAALGMQFGALMINANAFVPQSRERVFLVAVDERVDVARWTLPEPSRKLSTLPLLEAHRRLSDDLKMRWRWWKLRDAPPMAVSLSEIVEPEAQVAWHEPDRTSALLGLMNRANRTKIDTVLDSGRTQIGFLYKRTRGDGQRAEVRFDGIAGCLRTPKGGSSRQTVVLVANGRVRTRLLTAREAARLMGVPDSFILPDRYNNAYKAMGDGVIVPAVTWLSDHLLRPLAKAVEPVRQPLPQSNHRVISERRASQWLAEHRP